MKKVVIIVNKPERNDKAMYKTVKQIMEITNLSRDLVMMVAKDAGALIHIGSVYRINENNRKIVMEVIDG